MSFLSDSLVEKIRLKRSLIIWQTVSLIFVLSLLFLSKDIDFKNLFSINEPYIARISISGFIDKDYERDKIIRSMASDKFVEGLLIHVDSPGGTLIGGETLYSAIKEFSSTKKVVVLMGSMATSGAYMTSLAANHIVAHNGTITGSIGVIMQSPDFSGVMKKVGLDLNIIRSGKLKGVPSMFQPLNDESRVYLQSSLEEAYKYFISLVLAERGITDSKIINDISTGRIYTASQALNISLIDEIGDERSAIHWFEANDIKSKIKDVDLSQQKGIKKLQKFSSVFFKSEEKFSLSDFLLILSRGQILALLM